MCVWKMGPPGTLSPLAWISQINNIFHFCLCNYTRSFSRGSSRPPHSLITSASQLQPSCMASCLWSSLGLPWRPCQHEEWGWGRCQVEQGNITADLTPLRFRWQASKMRVEGIREEVGKEGDWKWASIPGDDPLLLPNEDKKCQIDGGWKMA